MLIPDPYLSIRYILRLKTEAKNCRKKKYVYLQSLNLALCTLPTASQLDTFRGTQFCNHYTNISDRLLFSDSSNNTENRFMSTFYQHQVFYSFRILQIMLFRLKKDIKITHKTTIHRNERIMDKENNMNHGLLWMLRAASRRDPGIVGANELSCDSLILTLLMALRLFLEGVARHSSGIGFHSSNYEKRKHDQFHGSHHSQD